MTGVPGTDVAHVLGALAPSQDGIDPSHVTEFEQHAAASAQSAAAVGVPQGQDGAIATGSATPMPAAFVPGVQPAQLSGKGIGHQVLDGLERFGRSLSEFNSWGHRTSPLQPAMLQSPSASTDTQGAAGETGIDRMMAFEQTAEQEQARNFATELDVEVAIDSSGALMKSLKSLLTQGGG